jgi:AhpD family alkylhydroperoxidase
MFESNNLSNLNRLDENTPETLTAFWEFENQAFKAGAIDCVHKQLMAIAVALTTQCPHCIQRHLRAGRKEGATEQMLHEAVTVATALRQWHSITQRTHLFWDE